MEHNNRAREQVVLAVGGRVSMDGEIGKKWLSVAVTSFIDKSLMWAGFRQSSDIISYCWHLNLLVSGTKITQYIYETNLRTPQACVLFRT